MKNFIKKFLIILLLYVVSQTVMALSLYTIYNEGELFAFPLILLFAFIIGLVYSLLFVLIDLINQTSVRYSIIYNLIFIAFITIFYIWDFIFYSGAAGSASFENFTLFYFPILFLIIHLVYVLYKRFK